MECQIKNPKTNSNYIANATTAFESYSDMVYRLAFVRTGNQTDADDILSEVFLRLVKNINKIQNEEHLKSWLIRVTINCTHSFFTGIKRRQESPLSDCTAFVLLENNEVLPTVLKLPHNQKTIIYMYYFEGYSIAEIAKLCSIPVGTVKSRLARARDNLKKELKGANFDV